MWPSLQVTRFLSGNQPIITPRLELVCCKISLNYDWKINLHKSHFCTWSLYPSSVRNIPLALYLTCTALISYSYYIL